MSEKTIVETKSTEKLDDDETITLFRLDISADADNLQEQRQKANEDMRFTNVSGGMWEGFLESEYTNRTRLELDIVSDYLQRFIGEWNQNRVGVDFKPDDDKTTDDDAELINGIYRADFRNNSGKMSTDNAVDETATCGFGAFKIATCFDDDEDPENDNQHVEWRPVHEAYNTIFFDRSGQRIDKRDARHCTELTEYTPESFEVAYPGAAPVSAYTPDTLSFNNHSTSSKTIIYIASRYQVIKKKEFVFIYNNLVNEEVELYTEDEHKLIEKELKADDRRKFVRKRKVFKQSVEKTVFSGSEILEPTRRIAGKWIPIIPMYGFRSYVDGEEWYRGLIRKLKDAARLFNMQISQLAENAASSGQEIPIFDPDQMEGDIKNLWADRNNKPYLLARALRNDDGTVIAHGPSGYLKPAQLDGSTTALLQLIPQFVRESTGGMPQDTLNPDASGKAINALIKRGNLNTQVVTDNIANAIERSGEVYQAIAAEVYNTPRIIQILGKDGNFAQKKLFKITVDSETGKTIEANTLRGKKFRSYSDVGPQYDSLREQTVEELKGMAELLTNSPGGEQYLPAVMAIMMDNITGVGLGPLKDMVRNQMLIMGLVKPETDEEIAFVQNSQAEQQKNPNEDLIQAAAAREMSESRERDSKTIQNFANAKKAEAETAETLVDTEISIDENELSKLETASKLREQDFKEAQAELS